MDILTARDEKRSPFRRLSRTGKAAFSLPQQYFGAEMHPSDEPELPKPSNSPAATPAHHENPRGAVCDAF